MTRTILFLADAHGKLISATILDEDREPVDGLTGITPVDALCYFADHPEAAIETATI